MGITEQMYHKQYSIYLNRSTDTNTAVNLFIPNNTKLIVWDTLANIVSELSVYMDYWYIRKQSITSIPDHISTHRVVYANKDIVVPMVKLDDGFSHIASELNGEPRQTIRNDKEYSLWVHLYQHPTYIKELGKSIMGYGVWESEIPQVYACSHYHPTYKHYL